MERVISDSRNEVAIGGTQMGGGALRSSKHERIIGVDIAKIVAMILVVAVHVNGFGLPYVGDNPPGLGYLLLRSFLGAIFMACINIFAIASGYAGIMSTFKISRLIRLWIQIVFTGLMVLVYLDLFTDIDVSLKNYVKACIPIAKKQYWYMTAYFMLCLVMPVLNAGIKSLNQKELRNLVLLLLGLVCGESFLLSSGALGVESGYSFEWLLVLYVVGAYLRLYNPRDKSNWSLLGGVCLCAMIAGWASPILKKSVAHFGIIIPRLFEFGGYTSPFTVLIALAVFLLCLKIPVTSERARKLIISLSSTTLGVYLIHVQPVFFSKVFGKMVSKLALTEGGGYLCAIILLTLAIYIACTILDFLRLMSFRLVGRWLTIKRVKEPKLNRC